MLIDDFLLSYDVRENHSIDINAPPEAIYRTLLTLNLSRSVIIRVLFLLRGMPASCLTLEGLFDLGFVVLAENRPREFLLGLIGKFWLPRGELLRFEADSFTAFHKQGYAKAALNLSFEEASSRTTRVSTETRVFCTDEQSRRRFRLYWLLVRPFSGLIRKEILRTLKRQLERTGEY